MIYSSPYRGEASLSLDSVMNTRKKVLKQHIHGEFENTYMITDTTELPEGRLVQDFNKNTVREVRGLWEMKNEFMGGPFISYSVHDKLNNRVITLEGFVFAPGERKKVYIRQLEVILKSLKLKQE
ncbi:MAG: DUF4837 family protein [Bacteroidetes bacterium]|nr:DUF4837 family protein [Bacteroidota bacterium]